MHFFIPTTSGTSITQYVRTTLHGNINDIQAGKSLSRDFILLTERSLFCKRIQARIDKYLNEIKIALDV